MGVFINHANMELRQNIIWNKSMEILTAKPTRVAMEELQLHDLKNMDATRVLQLKTSKEQGLYVPAVDVKQNAIPAKHEEATEPNTPAIGSESKTPIVVTVVVDEEEALQPDCAAAAVLEAIGVYQ
ncbi:hypothetical protein EIP86_005643 [Pleurotus ostreatoroseus]|nr:hypothetical protein EIP86_005643 [Pleurotus ostreatoroseus]